MTPEMIQEKVAFIERSILGNQQKGDVFASITTIYTQIYQLLADSTVPSDAIIKIYDLVTTAAYPLEPKRWEPMIYFFIRSASVQSVLSENEITRPFIPRKPQVSSLALQPINASALLADSRAQEIVFEPPIDEESTRESPGQHAIIDDPYDGRLFTEDEPMVHSMILRDVPIRDDEDTEEFHSIEDLL